MTNHKGKKIVYDCIWWLKIGIISDTHDDIENVQSAREIFNADWIDHVIHAGECVFLGIVQEFEKLNAMYIC